MSTTLSKATTLRSAFAQHLELRRRNVQLERELAEYDTPTARDDLHAMLARHSDEQSAPIRRILSRQAQLLPVRRTR